MRSITICRVKGRILIITTSGGKTVYAPLDRLLRMEVTPQRAPMVSTVTLHFEEGFRIVLQTDQDPGKVARDLYERIIKPDDRDEIYVRDDDEGVAKVLLFQQE